MWCIYDRNHDLPCVLRVKIVTSTTDAVGSLDTPLPDMITHRALTLVDNRGFGRIRVPIMSHALKYNRTIFMTSFH